MATYNFPTEGDILLPMCLVLFSPPEEISSLSSLMELVHDLEEADQFGYRAQYFATRVEIHFSRLDFFSVLLILVFILSLKHKDLGDWCFVPSDAGVVL